MCQVRGNRVLVDLNRAPIVANLHFRRSLSTHRRSGRERRDRWKETCGYHPRHLSEKLAPRQACQCGWRGNSFSEQMGLLEARQRKPNQGVICGNAQFLPHNRGQIADRSMAVAVSPYEVSGQI